MHGMSHVSDAGSHWGRVPIIGYDRKGRPIYPIVGGAPGAAVATAPQQQQQPASGGVVNPFVKATHRKSEKFDSTTTTPTTTAVDVGPKSVIPGGFLRGITMQVSCSGGALGGGTLNGDYPFKLFKSITLEDVGGNPIAGPLTGYDLYLFNKYYNGSYFAGDPTILPGYVGTVNAVFKLWIPCEIRSDGWGALGNTDARAQYRVKYTIDTLANIISGGAPTAPAVVVDLFADTYGQPEPQNLAGVPNRLVPPGLGTTQFLHKETQNVSAAAQNIKHNIVGNLISGWIYVCRDSSGVRQNHLTDPIRIRLDTQYIIPSESPAKRQMQGVQDLVDPNTAETGVYVYSRKRSLDGAAGPGDEGNYLETNESTFLQLEDTFGAGASTIDILTCDIAPHGEFAAVYS